MADQDFNIKVVTTADTSGLQQTRKEMDALGNSAQTGVEKWIAAQKAAKAAQDTGAPATKEALGESDRIASHIQTNLTRTLVHAAGVGFVLELVRGLTEASKEIEKISEQLNKQGEQLIKNAQASQFASRFAKDEGDQLKISSAALSKIAETRKTLNEISQKDLSAWAKFSDAINKFAQGRADYAEALSEEQKTAFDQYQAAQKEAMDEVLRSEAALGKSFEDNVKELNNLIAAEEKHKQTAKAANDAAGYVAAANAAQRYKKELDAITDAHNKEAEAADKAARANAQAEAGFLKNAVATAQPQVQSALKNEEAARQARQAGMEKEADQLQKTADQFKKSFTPEQQQEYEGLTQSVRLGRKASPGESQDKIDDITRNAINFQRQLAGQPPLPTGAVQGNDALRAAIQQAFDGAMSKYWGP